MGKFIIFSAKGVYYGDELLNYFFYKQEHDDIIALENSQELEVQALFSHVKILFSQHHVKNPSPLGWYGGGTVLNAPMPC